MIEAKLYPDIQNLSKMTFGTSWFIPTFIIIGLFVGHIRSVSA